MPTVPDLDEKFRLLAGLRRICPDVMEPTPNRSRNAQARRSFKETRSEIVEAIGLDEFNRRLEPYLIEIEHDEVVQAEREEKERKESLSLLLLRVPCAIVRQNPVGHGGFHTGTLGIEQNRLHWVYDCGSWRKKDSLAKCVENFSSTLAPFDSLDLLFVSHFDADHVNGLRHLLATVARPVDTVVIPYLGADDMFVVISGALAENRCSNDLIDQVLDPVRWFRRLGVRRVIRLRPPSMPDESDDGRLPEEPRGGAGGPRLPTDGQTTEKQRLSPVFIQPDGERFSDGNSVVASSGTFAGVWTDHVWADWIFLPFVHPVSNATRRRVRRLAKTVVGVKVGTRTLFRYHSS